MKKILFMIHDLSVGGAEKVLVNLVNNMDYSKYKITVMALFDGGVNRQFLDKEVNYKYCFKHTFRGNSHFMKLFSAEQLYRCFIKEDYDVVISFLEGPTARIVSGCFNKNTKVISWIHCTMHSERELAASFRNIEEARRCYQRFDAMVFVSKEVKDAFLQICPISKKVQVLYNTNESAKIKKMAGLHEETFFMKTGMFYWCGIGKIVPNKGFDRMIRIQKRLIDEGYLTHFLALGVGQQSKELIQWCEDNGISDSVSFLGYQTNPYQFLAKCDLFVCASHTEGFSTAATEALLLGVPVLTTRVSGMAEMLGANNEYGIIVENDENALYYKIKELLDDPKMLIYYKEKARIRGNDFCTERTVKAVEKFFDSLV